MDFPQIFLITNFGMRLSWKSLMRARNWREIKKVIKEENKRHRRLGLFFFFFFFQHLILLLKELHIGIMHLELTRIIETLQ